MEPIHVAAFVVARYRAGVSASGLSANLSAIGWFHARLDPPVVDVTAVAKTALPRLAAALVADAVDDYLFTTSCCTRVDA